LQRLLSTATIVGLLIATAAAFAITERLKLTKAPITAPKITAIFSPDAHGTAKIRVVFRRADVVTVTIESSGRSTVDTLVADEPRPRGVNHFTWNGRTDAGGLARDGTYYVQIHFARQRRTILMPNKIRLDTTLPAVLDAHALRLQFSPDGDHQADSVSIEYKLSKPGHLVAFLRGQELIHTRVAQTTGRVRWYGRLGLTVLPQGTYVLQVGAIDEAGNRSDPANDAHVRIELRYITLASRRITGVKAGGRFDVGVSTDATRYGWRLGTRHGFAHLPVLTLRAPRTPGTYVLTVTEHGHSDHALVVVR